MVSTGLNAYDIACAGANARNAYRALIATSLLPYHSARIGNTCTPASGAFCGALVGLGSAFADVPTSDVDFSTIVGEVLLFVSPLACFHSGIGAVNELRTYSPALAPAALAAATSSANAALRSPEYVGVW